MATEAYDVVRSLRELLQSQERRDKDRVETALQAMQFAQAKKMQDVQLAGQQIQFLQTVNTQQMKSIAAKFINNTGFGRLYSPTEDEDERASAVEDAVDTNPAQPNVPPSAASLPAPIQPQVQPQAINLVQPSNFNVNQNVQTPVPSSTPPPTSGGTGGGGGY